MHVPVNSTAMSIQQEVHGSVAVLRPVGRLGGAISSQLEDQVRAAIENGSRAVVFDLSSTSHIASAGLRVTLNAVKLLAAVQGRLIIAAASPAVREVLQTSGVSAVCELVATPDEALARLK
jgi:anti-anti-sigma factor